MPEDRDQVLGREVVGELAGHVNRVQVRVAAAGLTQDQVTPSWWWTPAATPAGQEGLTRGSWA